MAGEQQQEQTTAHDQAFDKVAGMFGAGEEQQTQERPDRQRNADGTFARQESEVPVQDGAQGTEQQGQETAQQQSEETEVEIEGEKYIVPKKIADKFIHHADYTRKTQDIAEMRRALSAEREVATLNKAFDQSVAVEQQNLLMLSAQIEQFRKLDWQAMETEQLLKARASLDQLRDAKAELETSIKAKRADFDQKIKGHVQEAMQAGEKYITQHIKGWNDETKKTLHSYGISQGYTHEEMSKIADPRIVVSLNKARLWDELQASQPGVQKRASQAAPTVRPGATQRQPNKIQQLGKAIKEAKGPTAKRDAAVDYFAAKWSR